MISLVLRQLKLMEGNLKVNSKEFELIQENLSEFEGNYANFLEFTIIGDNSGEFGKINK